MANALVTAFSRGLSTGQKSFSSVVGNRGGWLPTIRESFSGAWQNNVEVNRDTALTYFAVFSCMTLIARDISKLGLRLVEKGPDGIWVETENSAYSPVLRKPNNIQNRIQFFEHYFLSKLSNGNVYVLKERDKRNVVVSLHILDPQLVQTLVTPSGEVFYRLSADNLSGVEEDITVPAYDIIHDRMNCIRHPLLGLSPLVAGGLAAMQGNAIQNDSANFFTNSALPGGILAAPGEISDDTAVRLKEYWDTNFTGKNAGKIAVLGDNLKFEPMRVKATDAQMIETLQWTAENICSVFHVPRYKIGIGEMPSYNNIQSLNVGYYSLALQTQIKEAELCLNEGLGMPPRIGTQFALEELLLMDTASQMDVLEKAKGVMTLDERRKRLDLGGITGGDTVYLQQQDHSVEAIAARDRQIIDGTEPLVPISAPEPSEDDIERSAAVLEKHMRGLLNAQ